MDNDINAYLEQYASKGEPSDYSWRDCIKEEMDDEYKPEAVTIKTEFLDGMDVEEKGVFEDHSFGELNNNVYENCKIKEETELKRENLMEYSLGTEEVIIKSEESPDCSKKGRKKSWNCKICSYKSRTQRSLQLHLQTHADVKSTSFYCDECVYKTQDTLQFERHKQIHKHVGNIDKNCFVGTSARINSRTSQNKKQIGSKYFHCDLCDYRTAQKGHLTRHFLVHRKPEDVVMYRCHECSFSSNQKCRLRHHIKMIHLNRLSEGLNSQSITVFRTLAQIKEYGCSECSYKAVRSSDLKRHIVTHKKPNQATLFECQECNFKTKHKRNLVMHFSRHKNAEELHTYECSKCSFKTRLRYNLKRHYLSKRHLKIARASRGSLKQDISDT